MPHELLFSIAPDSLEVVPLFHAVRRRARPILRTSLILHERGGSFVHPSVPSLVGAYDHGNPHVSQLVGRHIVEVRRAQPVVVADEREHRELHPPRDDVRSFDGGHVGPGVGVTGEPGVVFDRVFAVQNLIGPKGSTVITPERVDHDAVLRPIAISVRDYSASRVP